MDDIKETVRNSGDSLCRAVSSLTARLCDVSLTSLADASDTMGIVLPLLLCEGIASKVASVQKASISMVMKLSKVCFKHQFLRNIMLVIVVWVILFQYLVIVNFI